MKRIFVDPLDVLVFRNEKPFIAMENHVAKTGVISPFTFEGAFKSKLFFNGIGKYGLEAKFFQRKNEGEDEFIERINEYGNGEILDLLSYIGYPDKKSKFVVNGVFFAKDGEYMEYFPVPNDVMEGKNERIIVKPNEKISSQISNSELTILTGKYMELEETDGFISFHELEKYLNGGVPNTIKNPYYVERRTGIKIDWKKKKTEEKYFYTIEFIRLKRNWGFIVWCDDPQNKLMEKGTIKLGGEGRAASYTKINDKKIGSSPIDCC